MDNNKKGSVLDALRAIQNGQINENVLALTNTIKKVDEYVPDKATKTEARPSKRKQMIEEEEVYEDFPEREPVYKDPMEVYARKLDEAKASGQKMENMNISLNTAPQIEVSPDAIANLLSGKLKEAKEIVQKQPEPTRHVSDPLSQYSKPSAPKQMITEKVIQTAPLNEDYLKKQIYETFVDEMIINHKLEEMIKKMLKPLLKEVLLEMKQNK